MSISISLSNISQLGQSSVAKAQNDQAAAVAAVPSGDEMTNADLLALQSSSVGLSLSSELAASQTSSHRDRLKHVLDRI